MSTWSHHSVSSCFLCKRRKQTGREVNCYRNPNNIHLRHLDSEMFRLELQIFECQSHFEGF